MSDTQKLLDELKEYSNDLENIDRHISGACLDHGIMTTIRLDTIDVIGRACIKLAELERELAQANKIADLIAEERDAFELALKTARLELAAANEAREKAERERDESALLVGGE